jgi:CRP/FNR family transcriptional regulator, cyclic AMP receptor protein
MEAKHLQAVPLFAGLSKHERGRIAGWADEIDVAAGSHLVDEGRFAHEFFVILDGTVDVLRGDVPIAHLGAGDFFGEIALVGHDRRTASVVAATQVRAIVMHHRDFDEMRQELPLVATRVHEAISERMARG